MVTNKENREQLDTNLFQKIMGDKLSLIVQLKEQRDALMASLKAQYEGLDDLKKQKKEIKRQIKLQKRAIIRNENERFSLNRELKKQKRLSNKLTVKYTNETDEVISSQKYYPENIQKTR